MSGAGADAGLCSGPRVGGIGDALRQQADIAGNFDADDRLAAASVSACASPGLSSCEHV